MKKFLFKMRLFFCNIFGRNYTAKICKHQTRLVAEFDVFGTEVIFVLNKKHLKYCPQCLARMSTRCSWCGKPILVGDPVTLYTYIEGNFEHIENPTMCGENSTRLVGCLRPDCADGPEDEAGFWNLPGKVSVHFNARKAYKLRRSRYEL